MAAEFYTISPVDGSVVATREYATKKRIRSAIEVATTAQKLWAKMSISRRLEICERALELLLTQRGQITEEITRQMGRPICYAGGELNGVQERARYLMSVAEEQLANVDVSPKDGFARHIKREPLGVVFIMAPWNYPYLTVVNSLFPAILSGNAVILKHSPQTPLCSERLVAAFTEAGIPAGVFQFLHVKDIDVSTVLSTPEIAMVCFTGSVRVGRLIEQHVAGHFKHTLLELGGKDPAYVRRDAKLRYTIENLVDGAFFNSGQSCCAIERIYVDETIAAEFIEDFVEQTTKLRLGHPLNLETTLGPVVSLDAAERIRNQINEALHAGAESCIDQRKFPLAEEGTPYLAPQVLIRVSKAMSIMTEETFGPVVTIIPVSGDHEAIKLMNDSQYGLTASLWTDDLDRAEALGEQLEAGTIFMNRCDYLDPELPWTGVKNSGKGFSLSRFSFQQMTRPKSFHFKLLN